MKPEGPDVQMPRPRDEPVRHPWIYAVYLFLFAVSIPWYFRSGRAPRIWLGLPDWVVVSLLATLAIAVFTAFVIQRYWKDDLEPDQSEEPGDPG